MLPVNSMYVLVIFSKYMLVLFVCVRRDDRTSDHHDEPHATGRDHEGAHRDHLGRCSHQAVRLSLCLRSVP